VRVALHPEVIVTITANVAKSEEEAEVQLKNGGYVGTTENRAASLDDLLADADAQMPPEAAAQPEAEGEGENEAKED
jgi:large subunit ribosomal protein L9